MHELKMKIEMKEFRDILSIFLNLYWLKLLAYGKQELKDNILKFHLPQSVQKIIAFILSKKN